jgi:hypothetical protein
MIKMLTAYTFEIDDPQLAVQEVLGQLDFTRDLLKSTVGLMFCTLDFIQSGTAGAVGKALPFDVLGCTTMGIALPGVMGEMLLGLAVLTSDDVTFSAGLSEPLTDAPEQRLAGLYQDLAASLPEKPSLMLSFPPQLDALGGDGIVDILDRLSGGLPIFGTFALDETGTVRTPRTIYNDGAYADRGALLLLSGSGEPRFAIDSIGERQTYSHRALITAAEGNRIISINNIPGAVYMENLGLMTDGTVDMLYAFPLSLDDHSGEKPRICLILSSDPNGSLVCGASVSPGSTLSIVSPSSGEVLETARNIAGQAKETRGRDLLFVFSCFSRSIALTEFNDEMNLIQRELADLPIPYLFLYSGGEICPVKKQPGQYHNRHHNYAIISCLL